ncbi:MAG: hypothetical protein RBT34_00215 [Anaerolineaceae bacterium]|jgi:hypothetical protein|nr:hypothetical protein [Anaerolineaceae bacterium]
MNESCIENIGGVYVTNLFWICNCKEDFLCINGLGKCPLCNLQEADGAPADISTVLQHADELDKNRVQEILNALTTENEDLCLEDLLLAVAKTNGFHESDETGVLYILTVADAVNTLLRMLDDKSIGLQELTGDNFQDLFQHVADNLTFDWDDQIRYVIEEWQDIRRTKAQEAEDAEIRAAEEALIAEARAAAAEAIADNHYARFDCDDQEPFDGI